MYVLDQKIRKLCISLQKFMPYFTNKLFPLLKEHVIEPMKNGKITGAWTNNNCECADSYKTCHSSLASKKRDVGPSVTKEITDYPTGIYITRQT